MLTNKKKTEDEDQATNDETLHRPESETNEDNTESRNSDDSEDNGGSANSDEIGESSNRGESSTNPDDNGKSTDTGDDDQGGNHESVNTDDEAETFPKSYVQKLRDENAKYRQRAQKSDELAHRLHRALVEADGRLADPTDLEFTEDHLEDAETLSEAIGELLRTKPHLAARRPAGDIGQGASGANSSAVDLAGLLRAGAN